MNLEGGAVTKPNPFLDSGYFKFTSYTVVDILRPVSIYSLSFSLSYHYFLGFTILHDIKSAADVKHPDRPSRLI